MAARADVANKPRRRAADLRGDFLLRVADAAGQKSCQGIPVKPFILDYYRDLDIEELQNGDPDRLARAAIEHLRFALKRRPGRSKVRVYNTADHRTVIEIVNANMPFVVDAVSIAVAEAGLGIDLTVHPIFSVCRDKEGKLLSVEACDLECSAANTESIARFDLQHIPDQAERDALTKAVRNNLADTRAAVTDWRKMMQKMTEVIQANRSSPPPVRKDVLNESLALLEWLVDNNFTFLGYRRYELAPLPDPEEIRPLTHTSMGILARKVRQPHSRPLTRQMAKVVRRKTLLIITKANSRATVHRTGYLDHIGIKIYNAAGEVSGEHRFIGLFTSTAYSQSPRRIPMLRRKVKRVFEESGLSTDTHRGKSLMHILENYPRDELLQSTVADLVRTTDGILSLQDRRQVRLLIRKDVFRRFISCMVYVPRDKYNTRVRKKIESILQKNIGGVASDAVVEISESALARLSLQVRLPADHRSKFDILATEKEIAAAIVTWPDRLLKTLLNHYDVAAADALFKQFKNAFPSSYQEDVDPDTGCICIDIEHIRKILSGESRLELRLHSFNTGGNATLRFKLIRALEPLPLSGIVPILENFGMRVISEYPYHIECADQSVISIQEVEVEHPDCNVDDFSELAGRFEESFRKVIDGVVENDGLNRLVWLAGLDWREIVIIRTYTKYILQTGAPFSQSYIEEVLCANGAAARLFAKTFKARFSLHVPDDERVPRATRLLADLQKLLEHISSLDEDRIFRAFESSLLATLRTNFFVRKTALGNPPECVSIKMDPRDIAELPEPRPQFEIFVYSPDVEGIHLRAGPVARGGLRWSDRREDFRTEVLGLMKAQVVKNAVIVPTGSKGGFVLKQAARLDRDALGREVERCYRIFIGGLLDVTDTIVNHKVVPPRDVKRLDGDDPYLVVAADKGTASFSDTANEVADGYGFWLGDAFASGGSVGYDHKKMGITAKGAWEAVKRHFRELGTDIQKQPFSVAGIGDMAGDVFGNGMLLSEHICLKAAFNHLHIFLDPTPDPAVSFAERRRLFETPRSSWADYRSKLISSGGGVYDRKTKRIDLSPQARAMLGAEKSSVTPPELIRLILCMEVDLLWNGGIGTYVKASTESHLDAGDRTNDAVRVDAGALRCKVIGEGGNLGLTQAARVEFSRAGGMVYTDSIDNSAGVSCSDHEVNIKILLNHAMRDKRLGLAARNRLLASMTDEVAELVLRDNYLQTQAISRAHSYAADRLMEYAELIKSLESTAGLDRELEGLPDDEEIENRRTSGRGLTRPELAIIFSYAKIHLFNDLLDSDIPEDETLTCELIRYFPSRLQKKFRSDILIHPLRREIISTLISNSIINRVGPTYVPRAKEETGASTAAVARAYTVARDVLNMRKLWAQIEEMDNVIPSSAQYAMLFHSARKLRHAAYWFLQNYGENLDITAQTEGLRPGIKQLLGKLPTLLSGSPRRRFQETTTQYLEVGVPEGMARRMAALNAAVAALDIAAVAMRFDRPIEFTAEVYAEIGRGLSLDWLQAQAENLIVTGRWQAIARGNMRNDLLAVHRKLTADRIANADGDTDTAAILVMNWLQQHGAQVQKAKLTISEIRAQKAVDFASLTVTVQELRRLAAASARLA